MTNKPKQKKTKKSTTPSFSSIGWNTTDAEEIERRRVRGQLEKFHFSAANPGEKYFGSYLIRSERDKQYQVEIRSLTEHINSCNCPDASGNGLGTCKHIEHILFRLRKTGVRAFNLAAKEGASHTEIYLDTRDAPRICIRWGKSLPVSLQKVLESFFSSDGSLLGNLLVTYPALRTALLSIENAAAQVRVSQHIDGFFERQQRLAQREIYEATFLKDVEVGKRSLDLMKFPLFPYQQQGMMHLAFGERALLADEMGLGKTVQAIAAAELLRRNKNIQRVLVVATASLKAEWEEQISKFTDLPVRIIQGTRKDRLKQYQEPSFFYLTNYEQVVMDQAEIQRLLLPDLVILDEAQRIKNWQTKTANTIKELKSPYAFVLTGTPLENRIDDVYSIVQFLDPHLFGPLFRFNRDFYQLDEQGKAIGYKNLNELHRRLKGIMLRRRKEDVEGQLPTRTVNNYFVQMDPEQGDRYTEYEEQVSRLVARAQKRPLRKEEMEKLQKFLSCMRMLCDTPYILDQKCRIAPKIDELDSILTDLLADESSKVIIFSEWERMLELVADWATEKEYGFAWHTGSVPQQRRRVEINRFKTDPHCRLFLSTDSGSVGLNLQAANVVINLDLPWNPAKLEQRIARAWRKHQTRSVQVINLITENSIEHRMLYLLGQKQTLATGVLDGLEDLQSMQLPSGRAAFMERMQALMGEAEPVTPLETEKPKATESVTKRILAQIDNQIDLIQRYRDQISDEDIIFAVVERGAENLQMQLQQLMAEESPKQAPRVEVLDRETYSTLQRLINAGVIQMNKPEEILHAAPGMVESKQQIAEQDRIQALRLLKESTHQLRLTKVLLDSEFCAEALLPLKRAITSVIHALAHTAGHGERPESERLSAEFIQEVLIQQQAHPAKLFLLWGYCQNDPVESSIEQLQSVWTDTQSVLEFAERVLE